MIEQVSDYFKGVIQEIDSDLEFDGMVFGSSMIPDYNLDYAYKLIIGEMRLRRQDAQIEADLPVMIKIYRVSNIDKQETDFFDIYCKGIDIVALSMNQTRVLQDKYIKSIFGLGIYPQPILDNDTTIELSLEFSVKIVFKNLI